MNHGLRLLFLLAHLTELFSGQDYLASINVSQRKRVKAGGRYVEPACRIILPES